MKGKREGANNSTKHQLYSILQINSDTRYKYEMVNDCLFVYSHHFAKFAIVNQFSLV